MNLQNLVDYCEEFDLPSPFAGASVPAPLNIDTCISAIMVRCGLLTPCYNDPDTFRNITAIWFERKQWTFEHLIKIIQADYNPTENVFELRNEKTKYGRNMTKSGGYKDTEAGKDTEAHSGTDSISHSGTDTTTNEISAFNASTYQADNKSSVLHGHGIGTTHGESIDTTYGHNVTRVYNSQKDQEGGTDEVIMSRHGNVGTISVDKLIEEELNLLRHFDIYGYIAELFENENMLMIY